MRHGHTRLRSALGFAALICTGPPAEAQDCSAPPAAPASVTPEVREEFVDLVWSAVDGSTSYVVEAGTASGRTDVARTEMPATRPGFVSSAANGTYFARVLGKNACGKSAPSPEVSLTVTAGVRPGVPDARTATRWLHSGVDFSGDLVLTGRVVGGWGTGVATFIRVIAELRDSAGDLLDDDFTYVRAGLDGSTARSQATRRSVRVSSDASACSQGCGPPSFRGSIYSPATT